MSLMDQLLIIEREKAELRKLVDDQCAVAKGLRSEVDALEHENETLRSVNSSLSVRCQSLERRVVRVQSLAQRMDSTVSNAQAAQRMEAMYQPSWSGIPAVGPALESSDVLKNVEALNTVFPYQSVSELQMPAPPPVAPRESLGSIQPVSLKEPLPTVPPVREVPPVKDTSGSMPFVPEKAGEAAKDSVREVQFGTTEAALNQHRAASKEKSAQRPEMKLDTVKMMVDECPASPKTAKDARKSQWGDSSPKGRPKKN